MAAQAALADPPTAPLAADWDSLPRVRALARRTKSVTLYAFLIAVSIPIILPYFWLVTIAFSAKTGIAETFVLWRSMFVLVPAVIGLWLAAILAKNRRQTLFAMAVVSLVAGGRHSPGWSGPSSTSEISSSCGSRTSHPSSARASAR